MKLGNELVVGSDKAKVPHDQNSLEVEFLTPGFNDSRELWVHHRLVSENGTGDWEIIKDPQSNKLFFSNLPSGNYQLELKSSYDGIEFSDTFKSAEFQILRPFYLRGWFLMLAVLFLVALGILINMFFRQLQNVGILQTAVNLESKNKVIAEQQFKNVWNSSQDGMLLTLEDEKILTVNPAFAKMMKTEILELEDQSLSVLFDSEDTQRFYLDTLHNRVRKTPGKGVSIETLINWKTGSLEMEVFFCHAGSG
ncbi:PAS domain S-box protein [Algoriphagus boritolerans]|uniref:PAS domain S-box protein n=1 Tax=Algoriphagus boritolerans TaxID=308111 RepID=UPI000AF3ED2B